MHRKTILWNIFSLLLAGFAVWDLGWNNSRQHALWLDILLIALGAFVLLSLIFHRRRVDRAAANLLAQSIILYSTDHEYQQANAGEFSAQDRAFCDAAQTALANLGFRFLGDVENLTLTRTYPSMRAFVRSMVSADGTTTVGIYHVSPRGFIRLLQMLRLLPGDIQGVDLETEFPDGTFVLTSFKPPTRMKIFPGLDMERVPWEAGHAALVSRHLARVEQRIAASPGLVALQARTLDDVVASQIRQQRIKNLTKSQEGFLTREDIQRAANKDTAEAADILGDALDRVKQK